jgi:uncharacterized protein YjbI with pentapeptide repeats
MRMNTDREHGKQQSRWGFRGMPFRDWLPIIGTLLIPVMVAAGSGWIIWHQGKIEGLRAEAERKLAEQRAQDEALQAYLDQMSQLILDRKLLEAEQGTPLYTLAQARTSTVILRLDAEHNESVSRFLINSGLAESSEASARLLREITLSHATLSGAYLPNADLSNADLSGADLNGADLSNADLNAPPKVVTLRGGGGYAYPVRANLNNANLSGADLSGANLRLADLSDADLPDADLSKADLSYAILFSADGITNEELQQQAASLEGAIMPDGRKYEDWIKDKEGRKGGGENG